MLANANVSQCEKHNILSTKYGQMQLFVTQYYRNILFFFDPSNFI